MDSTSTDNIREDAVSQVLGVDRPGRLRGMGRGATVTKLAFLQARDSHVQKLEATQAELLTQLEELRNVVSDLAAKKVISTSLILMLCTNMFKYAEIRIKLCEVNNIHLVRDRMMKSLRLSLVTLAKVELGASYWIGMQQMMLLLGKVNSALVYQAIKLVEFH